MFTGIVEGPGEIVGVADTDGGFSAGEISSDESSDGGRRLRIQTDLGFDDLHHGQSIAVSGVCLTVEEYGDDWFEVFLAAETVDKTYLGTVETGDTVNLERALAASDRFDGHIVQGHVDGTATVTEIEQVGDDWFFEFDLPESLSKYVVQKGSVCLDGISLTVADRREDSFAVAIIPTTYDLTTLSEKEVGDPVHVEVDVVAKYVESMLDGYTDRLLAE